MTSAADHMAVKQGAARRLPRLENGDHLDREEFERRYHAMPDLKKAELIEGVVYVPSPVRDREHGSPHAKLITWLGTYDADTPGVAVSDNATVRLDEHNEPQPDAQLRIDEARGGQSRIDEEGYVQGAPELVAEIAASSASYDLHSKLRSYQRHGVREYIVWRVLDKAVDWFSLEGDAYVRLEADDAGVYRSKIFPGLWLDAHALLADDMRRVLEVLRTGVGSDAHADFVRQLDHVVGSKT